MDILLINPTIDRAEPVPILHLGLAYIAQVLRQDGHRIQVLDINAYRWPPAVVEAKIKESRFDMAGITGKIIDYPEVKWLASVVKKHHPRATVVLGGGLATSIPEFTLRHIEADVLVMGEGEETAVELARTLDADKNMASVASICYRDGDGIRQTLPRPLIQDLDRIPFPARDLFPMQYYVNTPNWTFEIPRADMMTSRGCPYNCAFCFHGIFQRQHRSRSVENIVEEMLRLHRDYGVRAFNFHDDLFILNKRYVHEFCDALISQKARFSWACDGRANIVDYEVLSKMRAAGCVYVAYGIESGSQKILDNIGKEETVEQNRNAIKLTRKAGMVPLAFMMFGMIGETRETIAETVAFCKELGITPRLTFTMPFPGTPLFAQAKALGKIEDDLESYLQKTGTFLDRLNINLTDIPDRELIELRKQAERGLLRHYMTRHLDLYLKGLLVHTRVNGTGSVFRKVWRGFRYLLKKAGA